MIVCPECGGALPRSPYCGVCGARTGDGDYCSSCGAPISGPNHCPHCGVELTEPPAPLAGTAPAFIAAPTLPPRSRWRRWLVGCGCLPGTLLVLLILIAAAKGDLAALALATIAAVIPALIYLWIVLSLDRYEKEPLRAVGFAFGWGAVGAVLFSLFAELFFAGFAIVSAGEEAADAIVLVVGAPVIEEAFKGVALLLLLWFYRHELDSVLDGLVYGAVVGIGFAMTENIAYFIIAYEEDGISGLGELFVIRAVINGFGHAMYTGTIGAAIGWSRSRYSQGRARLLVPIGGYLAGVLLHMLWNGGVVLISEVQGDDATLWSVVLVELPLFVIPPLVILYIIARRGGETELAVMRAQLEEEIGYGVLTREEYEETVDHQRRRAKMRAARRRGWRIFQAQRHFYMAAGDLAYRKYHLTRGQPANADDRSQIWHSRSEIARTREVLRGGEAEGRIGGQGR